jgi:PAS domain S-box-containing protein
MSIGFAALAWILDSLMDALIFHESTFINQIINPPNHEIGIRILFGSIFIVFGIYLQKTQGALKAAVISAEDEKNKTKAIIDAIGDGIILQDPDYKILYQNQIQNEIYGNRVGEYCYKTYEGKDTICEDCPIEASFSDGKIHKAERIVPTDKGILYAELTGSALRDSTGKITGGVKVVRDITVSKTMEQTLREREEKYRRLVETLMEGIWELDKDANTTFVNPRMAQMLGYTVNEMLGKHFLSFMDEKGRMNAKFYLERRQQSLKEQHDFEFIRKDGTRIYTSLETSPITDENGNYSGAVVAIADITQRKRAEEKLREGEQFLESIFASIQDGIGIIDGDMNIIRANKTTESWYPYAAPLVGKKCYEAYHNRKERCELCPAWEALKTGKSAYNIVPKHGHEGKEVGWLEIYSCPLNDTITGKMKGVIEYVRDITERKRVEEELKQSEEKYRLLIENIKEGVFVIQDAKMQFANQAFAEITGYNIEDIIGMDFQHFVAPEDLEMVQNRYYRRQKGEDVPHEYEFHVLRGDGEKTLVNMSVGIVKYHGRVASMGILRDITERKRAEALINESEKKYRNLVELATDIIYLSDINGNQVFMNDAGYKILEAIPEEVIGQPWSKWLHPADREKSFKKFKEMVDNGIDVFDFENRYLSKSGSIINVLHNIREKWQRGGNRDPGNCKGYNGTQTSGERKG